MKITDIAYVAISAGCSYIVPLDYFYLLTNDAVEHINVVFLSTSSECMAGLSTLCSSIISIKNEFCRHNQNILRERKDNDIIANLKNTRFLYLTLRDSLYVQRNTYPHIFTKTRSSFFRPLKVISSITFRLNEVRAKLTIWLFRIIFEIVTAFSKFLESLFFRLKMFFFCEKNGLNFSRWMFLFLKKRIRSCICRLVTTGIFWYYAITYFFTQ